MSSKDIKRFTSRRAKIPLVMPRYLWLQQSEGKRGGGVAAPKPLPEVTPILIPQGMVYCAKLKGTDRLL